MRLQANVHDFEGLADLGRFSQLLEETDTSVVVVKKKLRRLSTVGRHDLKAAGSKFRRPFLCSMRIRDANDLKERAMWSVFLLCFL